MSKADEIEDIKIIEEFIEGENAFGEYEGNKYFKSIENLIAGYKKLEKQMGKDLDVVYIKGVYDERDKWKSKVKEKFIYYQNLYKQDNSPNEFLIGQDCLSKLSILQELLED